MKHFDRPSIRKCVMKMYFEFSNDYLFATNVIYYRSKLQTFIRRKKHTSKRFPFCVWCILCFYIVYLISWNSHVCLCFCLSVCLSLSGRGSQTMRTTVIKLLELTQWVWGKVSDWMPSLKSFSKGNFGAKSPLMPGIIASIISTCSVNLSFMSPATYQ